MVDTDTLNSIADDFIAASAPTRGLYCFTSQLDICRHVEANFSIVTPAPPKDDVLAALNRFYLLVGGDNFSKFSFPVIAALAMIRFQVSSGIGITTKGRAYMLALCRLQVALDLHGATVVANDRKDFLFSQIAMRVRSLHDIRMAAFFSRSSSRLGEDVGYMHLSDGMFRNQAALTAFPFASLNRGLCMFFDQCARSGYKLIGDDVYQPVVVNGRFLNAYKKLVVKHGGKELSDLKALLRHFPGECSFSFVSHYVCFSLMSHVCLTGGNMIHPSWNEIVNKMPQKLENHIKLHGSTYLSQISPRKTLYSFANGVYDSLADEFFEHLDPCVPGIADRVFPEITFRLQLMEDRYRDPLQFAETKEMPGYYKMMKEFATDFYNMIAFQYPSRQSTPGGSAFSVYSDPDECLKFVFMFLGRLLFELGLVDTGFEKFVCLIGLAGTGKSKVMDFIRYLVPNNVDLPADPEPRFFGMNIPGKELILADEVCSTWSLNPQWLLQVSCSRGLAGDTKVANAVKHEGQCIWTPTQPLFICGNSFPELPDESGQIERRLFAMLYDRVVSSHKKDCGLYDKLKNDTDAIIVGLCRHYLAATRCLPMGSIIDEFLPADLIRDRTTLLKTNNVVRQFLSQDASKQLVTFDRKGALSDLVMPVAVLQQEFTRFKKRFGDKKSIDMTELEWRQIQLITGIVPVVFEKGDEIKRLTSQGNVPTYEHIPVFDGVFGARTDQVAVCFPESSKMIYKTGSSQPFEFDNPQPQAFVHGICLNYNKCYRICKSDRLERDSQNPAQFSTEAIREYNSIVQCRTLDDFIRNRYISEDEAAYCTTLKRAIESSFSRREALRIAAEKEDDPDNIERKKKMLHMNDATAVEPGEVLSRYDLWVLDSIFGKRQISGRESGIFEVDGAVENGAKVLFGMASLEDAKRGIYRPTKISSEINRHMRVELYGLCKRLFRYAREATGDNKKKMEYLAKELTFFFEQYDKTCKFKE